MSANSKHFFSCELQESLPLYLKSLRDTIILAFEKLEPLHQFERTLWNHSSGGGGEMSVIRGDVFEKAAVNISTVYGTSFPLNASLGPYFATGISLITHMKNPHAPTAHMNIRFIQTQDSFWFGGGYDLTPMGFFYEEDKKHLHDVAQKSLTSFPSLYEQFSQNAKEYFFIPHRKKERGIGGLFFDHYNTGNLEEDLSMWKSVGESFLETVLPIYLKRVHQPYTEEEKTTQIKLRGHYVEFNLLYDRGTQFGFKSGGNPEAILCSLPPLVSW